MPPSGWRRVVMRWSPVAIAAAVLAALLWRYSPGEVARQLARGDWAAVLPYPLLALASGWLVASLADHIVLVGCCGAMRYRDVLRAKGAAALVGVVGYLFGQGGYALWIARFGGAKAREAAGATLYMMAAELLTLCLIATVAVLFAAPQNVPRTVLAVGAPLGGLLLLAAVLGRHEPLFGKGRTPRVFQPWTVLPLWRVLAQLALRVVQLGGCWIVPTWLACNAFGITVPFGAMATYGPVIMLVGALPANVLRLGAVQGAWLLLLDYGSGPQLLAFNLLWELALILLIVVRGVVFIRGAVADIDRGPDDLSAQPGEAAG